MGFFEALSRGLERSREALNEVFYFGGEVDEDFWENLEDTLVMGDMGAEISMQVTDDLRDEAARRNLKTARQLRGAGGPSVPGVRAARWRHLPRYPQLRAVCRHQRGWQDHHGGKDRQRHGAPWKEGCDR